MPPALPLPSRPAAKDPVLGVVLGPLGVALGQLSVSLGLILDLLGASRFSLWYQLWLSEHLVLVLGFKFLSLPLLLDSVIALGAPRPKFSSRSLSSAPASVIATVCLPYSWLAAAAKT